MLPAAPLSALASSNAFFKDANRIAAMLSFRATRRLMSGFVSAKSAGPKARQRPSTIHKAPLAAPLDSGHFRTARNAAPPLISAAPAEAAAPIKTTKRAYDCAIPSGDGHRNTPLSSPTKLPHATAETKESHPRPSHNKIEIPEMSATSASRIHRGKSRLG